MECTHCVRPGGEILAGRCLIGIGYAHCSEDNGGLSEDRALGMHTDCSARW